MEIISKSKEESSDDFLANFSYLDFKDRQCIDLNSVPTSRQLETVLW